VGEQAESEERKSAAVKMAGDFRLSEFFRMASPSGLRVFYG